MNEEPDVWVCISGIIMSVEPSVAVRMSENYPSLIYFYGTLV